MLNGNYLTVREVSKIWGVSERRVVKVIQDKGPGDSVKIGNAWLITEQDMESWRPGKPGRPRKK